MYIVIMIIDKRIWDEKLRYNINRTASKISTLSSSKTDKHDLTSEALLPPDQSRMTEKAKLTYSQLGKTCEKQA